MERITFQQIVDDKKISAKQRHKDLENLKKFKADSNERKFCGNNYLYHYQMENLCKTKVKKFSLYEKMMNDQEYKKLYEKAQKLNRTGNLANRLFEAERFNGAVVFFKPSVAKFLYKKFNATKVLDFTAGWGGRMLGAWSLGIDYTGIDTNINLKPAYDSMIQELDGNLKMIWDSCLNVDFSKLDYDFVLTSPPYINLEVYEHMTPFESNTFYEQFLIPMIEKSLKYIKKNGKVAINISPKMYEELIETFPPCDEEYDLLQQKRLGKDKQDKIYIWNNKKFMCQTCGNWYESKEELMNCLDCD